VLDVVEDHRRQLDKSDGNTKILYEFKKEEEERVSGGADTTAEDIFVN
jgi:hypothetical protein